MNEYKVDEVRISCLDSVILANDYKEEIRECDIKTIVTHEQFESVSYEVE